MLEEIKNYCCDTLFIDINNIKSYLDNLSTSDRNILLEQIYDYNNKQYKALEKQNKEFLKILNSKKVITDSPKNKISKVKEKLYSEEVKDDNQKLKVDISFYMECINNIKNLYELNEILPDKSNLDYVDIINSILIKLVEEMVIIKKLIKETSEGTKDMIYYEGELQKVLEKISYIKNYKSKIEISNEPITKKCNKVIFLTTNADNNCFMNDILKNVDEHCYEYVKELLNSIKYGTFKNVKAFTDNSLLTGVCEVKLSNIRIIFRRIKSGTYVVMQVLVKKFQTSRHYHSSMYARNSLYKSSEKELLAKVNDQKYLEYNENIYNDIINYLNVNKKGESNEKVNRKNK